MLTALSLFLAVSQTTSRSDAVVPPGGQVDAAPAESVVGAEQITAHRRADTTDQLSRESAAAPTAAQVATVKEANAPQPQITRERRGTGGAPQLAQGPRSATAPASAATRADGRRADVVRLGGSDRCDPQAGARNADCQRVIETRSAEYSAPRTPTLSPEQRLLLDQERSETRGVRAAARRVARNEVNPDALDTQALAAISLAQSAEPPAKPADPAALAGSETLTQIIEAVQSLTPKF